MVKKAVLLGVVLAVSTACGGGGNGHSAAYNDGYKAGQSLTTQQLQESTTWCTKALDAHDPKGDISNIPPAYRADFAQGCMDAAHSRGGLDNVF